MRKSLAVTFILIAGIALGLLTTKLISVATAEEEKGPLPKLFQEIGRHVESNNSVINVYCDRERNNLIYSYIVAAGNTADGSLVVLKDACK